MSNLPGSLKIATLKVRDVCDFLSFGLREADRKEVEFLYPNLCPEAAVMDFALKSPKAYIGRDSDNRPVGIYGIDWRVADCEYGQPWLLTTRLFTEMPRAVSMASLVVIPELFRGYSRLFNYIHVDNHVSIRWLKWMGFDVNETAPVLINGGEFYLFSYFVD